MSDVVIKAEGLSKCYRIGTRERMSETLMGAAWNWISSPIRNYRNLHRLGRFEDGEDSPDIAWALRDVSFEVNRGEVLGVIGNNGAGKSTLLKILTGITEPTKGRAEIRGRVASLLEVGTGFHPDLTGRENIYLNGTILGMTRKEVTSKLDEIVAFSGVEKFIDTPVKRYSSGMYVRLAFSVAAHLEPEILLIDEVLAVGDIAFQQKCMGKMKDVANSGRTILFVSHNMDAITRLCNCAIVLSSGTILPVRSTQEAVSSYLVSTTRLLSDPRLIDAGPIRKVSVICSEHPSDSVSWHWLDHHQYKVSFSVHATSPIPCPAVDMAMFTQRGTKLFACCSDENASASNVKSATWTTDFILSTDQLSTDGCFVDFGVRDLGLRFGMSSIGKARYLVHWEHAVDIRITSDKASMTHTSDSLIRPVTSVSSHP